MESKETGTGHILQIVSETSSKETRRFPHNPRASSRNAAKPLHGLMLARVEPWRGTQVLLSAEKLLYAHVAIAIRHDKEPNPQTSSHGTANMDYMHAFEPCLARKPKLEACSRREGKWVD